MTWQPIPRLMHLLIMGLCGLLLFGATSAAETVRDPLHLLQISKAGAGQDMPDFRLTRLDGQPVESKDLAGKVVLLNFWATWCGPCKDEMPALDRLRRQFDKEEFVLLAVTTDLQRDGIKAFMQQLGLGMPVLLDEDRDVSGSFMVRGLPTTVLIGKDGRIVGRAVGPRAWDSPDAVALVSNLLKAGR